MFPLESDINSRKVRYVLSIMRVRLSGRVSCRDDNPLPRLEESGQTWRLGIPEAFGLLGLRLFTVYRPGIRIDAACKKYSEK